MKIEKIKTKEIEKLHKWWNKNFESNGYGKITVRYQFEREKVKKLISKAIDRTAKEVLHTLDVEIEAWMLFHQKQNRTFETKDFIKHLRKQVF